MAISFILFSLWVYGKPHLIKTISHSLNKYWGGDPNNPRVLVLAPTGVAAVNFIATTIHSVLTIPCKGKLLLLNDKNPTKQRKKYSEVQRVIIDEISMVSRKLMYQVRKRLNKIFSSSRDILLCKDLTFISCHQFR